jgi:hypothetical protein
MISAVAVSCEKCGFTLHLVPPLDLEFLDRHEVWHREIGDITEGIVDKILAIMRGRTG